MLFVKSPGMSGLWSPSASSLSISSKSKKSSSPYLSLPCLLLFHKREMLLVKSFAAGEGKQNRKDSKSSIKAEDFDSIESSMQTSSQRRSQKNSKTSGPTLLEIQAEAIVASPKLSLRDRADAMNALLDLLEHGGIHTAYAFEFVRYSENLIDDLVTEAKKHTVAEDSSYCGKTDIGGKQESLLNEAELVFKLERKRGFSFEDAGLASGVYACAERRGLAKVVAYFQMLNMKASDVPKVIPFAGRTIDAVKAKVEFLRSIGIMSQNLPSVLASWPEFLCHEIHNMASVVEYLQGLGFPRKEVVAIILKHPNVLGQDVDVSLRRIVYLLEDIGSSSKDVKTILSRHPFLLLQEMHNKLQLLVDYLISGGIQRKKIGPLLVRQQVLISTDMDKDILPVIDYLKMLNATADDIDKIITSFPALLRYDLEKDLKPAVTQLASLGVTPCLMGKIFRRYPKLLKKRMNFSSKVQFLQDLGFKKEEFGRIIYNAPQLLALRVENLKSRVQFLENLGIKGTSLQKVLRLKPMVLAHSIEGKLQTNVDFLQNIGVNNRDIGRLVTRYPQLITLSVTKNLQPTFNYFLQLGFTREETTMMLTRLPSILSFSIANTLDPKYKFLIEVMQRSPKELVQFPHYFSYSLDRRILPRFASLKENHIHYSLSAIYGCDDVAFEKRLIHLNNYKKEKYKSQ